MLVIPIFTNRQMFFIIGGAYLAPLYQGIDSGYILYTAGTELDCVIFSLWEESAPWALRKLHHTSKLSSEFLHIYPLY